MTRLIWMKGLAGVLAHLLIAAVTIIVGLLLGVAMAELAKVIAAALE